MTKAVVYELWLMSYTRTMRKKSRSAVKPQNAKAAAKQNTERLKAALKANIRRRRQQSRERIADKKGEQG